MAKVITVTSAAVGVGKTSICVNLAAQLARQGQRVCLLDADDRGINVAGALGLEPRHTLADLMMSAAALDDVLIGNREGFDILPGGGDWLTVLTADQLQRLLTAIQQLGGYDVLLIDAPVGWLPCGLSRALATELILVMTAQPHSQDDACALIKQLRGKQPDAGIQLVFNRVKNHALGRLSYEQFLKLTQYRLGAPAPLLGLVVEDDELRFAAHGRRALVGYNPGAAAACDIGDLADRLLPALAVAPRGDAHRFCAHHRSGCQSSHRRRYSASAALSSPVCGKRQLQQQLEHLSDRVDALIREIDRLRSVETQSAALPCSVDGAGQSCSEDDLAGLANHSEVVTVHEDSFTIYSKRTSSGAPQHFAWHSPEDGLKFSEPSSGC